MAQVSGEKMKVRPVYNLAFPSRCPELNIFGYRFTRVKNYQEQFLSLQHLVSVHSEFATEPNTGAHAITAFVEIPELEKEAVFDWSGSNNTALKDVLLLLTLFTGRDVFVLKPQNSNEIKNTGGVIIADSRIYQWGGILRCSIPYRKQPVEPEPFSYDIGFEEGLNQLYSLIRSDEWRTEYKQGYYLILAKTAFRHRTLESTFIQCWTIWEHLFAILNDQWLSKKQIHLMSSTEKISFLLVKFALIGEIDSASRKRIEALAKIRNRLIHFGRFPEHETVHDDASLFIRLTEFIVAKTLGLSPSNLFNTVEKLEFFLNGSKK